MKTVRSLAAAVILASLSATAVAASAFTPSADAPGDGFRNIGGEAQITFTGEFAPSKVTREQVEAERVAFMKNPVSNGWRYVGGEAVWVYTGESL